MFGRTCWYCYWGWPKAVADIYDRALADIDNVLDEAVSPENDWTSPADPLCGEHALQFGPAHVVWSDENWNLAECCLQDCDSPMFAQWYPPALEIVRRSLRDLLALPRECWDVQPTDYDGKHPEQFPPPAGVEMIKR